VQSGKRQMQAGVLFCLFFHFGGYVSINYH
jgi:hypothetical protein